MGSTGGSEDELKEVLGKSSEFIMGLNRSGGRYGSVSGDKLQSTGPPRSGGGDSEKRSIGEASGTSEQVFYDDADLVTESRERIGKQRARKGALELERWWLASSLWQRIIPFMLLIFLILAVFQLVFGLIALAEAPDEMKNVEDPYVCSTQPCITIAEELHSSINPKANPCEDFYEYGCGNWINIDEKPDAIPSYIDLNHALMLFSDSQEAITSKTDLRHNSCPLHYFNFTLAGKILKPTGDEFGTDRLIDFYKSCIDESESPALFPTQL
jgi:hypothetical protein